MTKKRPDRLTEMIVEIEAMAKRLRAELRRAVRATGLTKNLEQAAAALRKQAALMAALVERYAHELRIGLFKGAAVPRRAARRSRAA
jgi:hypothetical protein